MNYEPDFKNVLEKANELLLQSNSINDFPFSAYKFTYEMSDAVLMKFSSIESDNLTAETILGTKDASLIENDGRYLLFYNEKMSRERIRFSVIHENGHYHLLHDMETVSAGRRNNNQSVESLYSKYEIEANFFAAQLLMPEQLLIELSRRGKRITKSFLQETFLVSEEAAMKRIDTLQKIYNWKTFRNNKYSLNLDDCILLKFKNFIDRVSPGKISLIEEFENEEELEKERQSWI